MFQCPTAVPVDHALKQAHGWRWGCSCMSLTVDSRSSLAAKITLCRRLHQGFDEPTFASRLRRRLHQGFDDSGRGLRFLARLWCGPAAKEIPSPGTVTCPGMLAPEGCGDTPWLAIAASFCPGVCLTGCTRLLPNPAMPALLSAAPPPSAFGLGSSGGSLSDALRIDPSSGRAPYCCRHEFSTP